MMELAPPSQKKPGPHVLREMNPFSISKSSEKTPQLNDFCRVCLLRKEQLRPLTTQFSGVLIPEMLYKVTGTLVNMHEQLPRVICERCLTKLDLAYSISEEFRKQEEKLRRFWWKGGALVDQLMAHQRTEECWRKTHSEEVIVRLTSDLRNPVPVVTTVPGELQNQAGASGSEIIEKTILPEPFVKPEPHEATAFHIEMLSDDFAEEVGESTGQSSFENQLEKEQHRTRVLSPEPQELLVEREFSDVSSFGLAAPSSLVEDGNNDKDSDYVPDVIYSGAENIIGDKDDISTAKEELRAHKMPHKKKTKKQFESHQTGHKFRKKAVSISGQRNDKESSSISQQEHGSFKCRICQKVFNKKYRWKQHEAHHDIAKVANQVQCQFCPLTFRWKSGLARHMAVRHKEPEEAPENDDDSYKCPKCGRVFKQQFRLELHLKRHEVIESGKFRCKNCYRVFGNKYDLTTHMLTYEKKPEWLKTCQKIMPPITIVKDGVTFLKCRDCPKVFGTQSHYFQHARIHAAAKSEPFQCPDCGKRFGQRANLRLHQQEMHSTFIKAEPEDPEERIPNETAVATSGEGLQSTYQASAQPPEEVTGSFFKTEAVIEESRVQENFSMDESQRKPYTAEATQNPCSSFVEIGNGTITPKSVSEWQNQSGTSGAKYANQQEPMLPDRVQALSVESELVDASGSSINVLSSDSDDEFVDNHESVPQPSTSGESTVAKAQTISIPKYMLMHESILNGQHKCQVCHNSFGSNTELQLHRRLVHNLKEPDTVECERCNKNIKKYKYKEHLKYHNNMYQRTIVCEKCDKAFGSKSHLRQHINAKSCEKDSWQKEAAHE